MHEAGVGLLMTSLTSSPEMVALMQTATTLPIFFLALPAGALADGVDRRRILIVTQTLMFVAAATLGVVALANAMTTWLLLILTFALGAGGYGILFGCLGAGAVAGAILLPEMQRRFPRIH